MNPEELKSGFLRLAEPVLPMADPYGRLLRRARRSRRHRVLGWTSALAAALVTVLAVPLLGSGAATPSPDPSVDPNLQQGAIITTWVARLLQAPTRGSLAADRSFRSDLTDRLAPEDFGLSPELNQETVLFSGDVGTYRAVLVAFHSDTRQTGVWLVGDAGTSVAQFAQTAVNNRARIKATGNSDRDPGPAMVLPEDLAPFTATGVSDAARNRYLAVGIAPPGCRVATTDNTHPGTWHDASTVDYMARSDVLATDQSTWVRVTCAGTLRYQAQILNNARVRLSEGPTQAQLDALVDAMPAGRGSRPDRALVRSSLTDVLSSGSRPKPTGCRVLYYGTVPGSGAGSAAPTSPTPDGRILVLACVTAHGNTAFEVSDDDGASSGFTRVKLDDPHAILALALPMKEQHTTIPLVILAPPTATVLQVGATGKSTVSLPLTDGIGGITVTPSGTVPLRALDAAGRLVGTGTAPSAADIPEERLAEYPLTDAWR